MPSTVLASSRHSINNAWMNIIICLGDDGPEKSEDESVSICM